MKDRILQDHLFSAGPKRILSLDGGGIRGVLTLGFLRRIEYLLRQRCGGSPEFRLCDYFDLIGGTSTGSIIAAGLAMGFSVDELHTLYHSLAGQIFRKHPWKLGLLSAKFPKDVLIKALDRHFGNIILGSDRIRTGLAVFTKRLDTGSPWIIHNNPRGIFYGPEGGGGAIPNRDFLLRQIIRASSAAPTYFEPERIRVADGVDAAFIDGGVSTFNNPALQMLMLATVKGYGYGWPLGPERLLLISVGTGNPDYNLPVGQVMGMPPLQIVAHSLLSLMNDCDWMAQTMLQWMSDCRNPWKIDSEIGDLRGEAVGDRELISYSRYNVLLESRWINENTGLRVDDKTARSLAEIDNIRNLELLENLGVEAADKQVSGEHFPESFDIAGM